MADVPDGLLVDETDGVFTVSLDRPHKHNALTVEMRQYLQTLPAAVAERSAVRCVVVRSDGPSFCAGADLGEIMEAGGTLPPTDPAAGLRALDVPTIVAVHATCVTGGLELALACDIIVAGRSARFADTHTKMDALPRWGMSAELPRRIGAGRALELSLTNRWVGGEEAHTIGLVDVLVDDDQLADRVAEIAAAAARTGADVGRAMTALCRHAGDGGVDDALAAEKAAWRAQADGAEL